MRADIEDKSVFDRFAAALDVTPEEKERAWNVMSKAGLPRDDMTALYFVLLAKFDGLTAGVTNDIRDAGKRNVVEVRKAVRAATEEAAHALPETMRKQFAGHMSSIATSLTDTTSAAIDREARRRDRTYMGGFALAVALLVVVASAGTYQMGRNAVSADAAQWGALVNLPDGERWVNLARLNPNIDRVLAQGCTVGEGRIVSGARICDLPLAVTAPIATSEGANAVRLSIAEWANRLGVWGLLGVGALLGWIGSSIARKLAR